MLGFSKISDDLGTANTLIFMRGKGIIMRERPSWPSIPHRYRPLRWPRRPWTSSAGRPAPSWSCAVKDGVIADFDITASMLRFLSKVCGASFSQSEFRHLYPVRR
jgi:rod shape-determining protein MreB